MARIPNGILGEFIGTAGNVSGYMRMGTNFIRSRRKPSTRPFSEARLAQQQKMSVCNKFTTLFSGSRFFDKTFPARTKTATGYNKATSALLRKAICGTYPDIRLSWPHVLISEGGMPGAISAEAAVDQSGNIIFLWEDNTGTGTAKESDRVVMVAYFPHHKEVVFKISESCRSHRQASLHTANTSGNAHTWLGFINEDGSDAADSVYAGMMVV